MNHNTIVILMGAITPPKAVNPTVVMSRKATNENLWKTLVQGIHPLGTINLQL